MNWEQNFKRSSFEFTCKFRINVIDCLLNNYNLVLVFDCNKFVFIHDNKEVLIVTHVVYVCMILLFIYTCMLVIDSHLLHWLQISNLGSHIDLLRHLPSSSELYDEAWEQLIGNLLGDHICRLLKHKMFHLIIMIIINKM